MKKILLFSTFLFSTLGFSQTVNNIPLSEIDVEYVQIVGTSKFLSTKLTVDIDFGQKTKFFSSGKETIIKDEKGQKMEFNSMVDALNFMAKNGFEFVNAYTISTNNQNVYHYILRNIKN